MAVVENQRDELHQDKRGRLARPIWALVSWSIISIALVVHSFMVRLVSGSEHRGA